MEVHMPNFRNGRMSEDIKREISAIIREDIKDPRVNGAFLSVVRTELSGDNSYCKVYISSLEGADAARTAVKGLESASGMIRRLIFGRLQMKKCPDFKFIADDSIEHSAKISEMLEKIETNNDSTEN